jgi:hypothetical protein
LVKTRVLVLLVLVASAACATVASIEVTRPPGEGAPVDTDQTNKEVAEAAAEAAPDPLPDGASDAPIFACACDQAVVDRHGACALLAIRVEQRYARRQTRGLRVLVGRTRRRCAARAKNCNSGQEKPTLRSRNHRSYLHVPPP